MDQPTKAFAQLDITYLKNRLDYEEILEELGISVSHRHGDWLMCHCPNIYAHKNGDQNPSFGFNTEEGYWNCFVCGSGTLLGLVQETLEFTEQDAVNWLREHSTFEPAKDEDIVEKITKILHPPQELVILPEFPDSAVFKYRFIHPYLLERGITEEVIKEMNVGFDEDHLGIIIPHWWKGKLRGWQVRHLLENEGKYYCPTCGQGNSPTTAKEPKLVAKYNNTLGFPKKYTIYNYDSQEFSSSGYVIVVESPMSVLKLKSLGQQYVVSTFGSFSDEQGDALAKFGLVYYWPDNDQAGLTNTQKIIKSLANRTELRIIPPVVGEKGDPGDLNSLEDVDDYISRAINPALYKLKTTTK